MHRPGHPALLRRSHSLLEDQRGFTGAEKALLICFALALIALVAALVSRGSGAAADDARRTLAQQGGWVSALGEAVRPIGASGEPGAPGGQGGAGSQGTGGQGGGTGPGGSGGEPSPWKVGGEGSGQGWSHSRKTQGERVFGGAPGQTAAEKEKEAQKKGGKFDAEIGAEYKFLDKEGALAEKSFAGGSEKVSAGYGKLDGKAFGKASLQEGAAVGAGVEGKASAVNWQGKHEIIGGIQESHEVDVLSVKGSLTGKAGISKDVVGASVAGEVGANLVEGKLEAKKELFKIPFTNIGVELGGGVSGAVGANASGEATAGYFKGEDNKSRFGFKIGGKAALGLGLGGKLSLNLVW